MLPWGSWPGCPSHLPSDPQGLLPGPGRLVTPRCTRGTGHTPTCIPKAPCPKSPQHWPSSMKPSCVPPALAVASGAPGSPALRHPLGGSFPGTAQSPPSRGLTRGPRVHVCQLGAVGVHRGRGPHSLAQLRWGPRRAAGVSRCPASPGPPPGALNFIVAVYCC